MFRLVRRSAAYLLLIAVLFGMPTRADALWECRIYPWPFWTKCSASQCEDHCGTFTCCSISLHVDKMHLDQNLIEVYGEPSVLLLPADDEPADEKNRMITVVAEERIRRNHPFLKFEV